MKLLLCWNKGLKAGSFIWLKLIHYDKYNNKTIYRELWGTQRRCMKYNSRTKGTRVSRTDR